LGRLLCSCVQNFFQCLCKIEQVLLFDD
jgi:hypothetical protein